MHARGRRGAQGRVPGQRGHPGVGRQGDRDCAARAGAPRAALGRASAPIASSRGKGRFWVLANTLPHINWAIELTLHVLEAHVLHWGELVRPQPLFKGQPMCNILQHWYRNFELLALRPCSGSKALDAARMLQLRMCGRPQEYAAPSPTPCDIVLSTGCWSVVC